MDNKVKKNNRTARVVKAALDRVLKTEANTASCFILAAVLLCGTHVLDAARAENMSGYDYVYFPRFFTRGRK